MLSLPGGQQPGEKGINKTARELGYTRDDIRRCYSIAHICEKAQALAIKFDLDNNESKLLKMAKEAGEEAQIAKAKELGEKKKRTKKPAIGNTKKHGASFTLKDAKSFSKLMAAWEGSASKLAFVEATDGARTKFIRMLQTLPAKSEDDEDDEAIDDAA
jgi:hypothetical protein